MIVGGKSPDTPVAVVRRCSWPDQEVVRATLATVAGTLAARAIRPPAVFVVGEAAALAPESSWFSQRPLFGVGVLVTRPVEQAQELRDGLMELGANVFVQPAIEIGPPPDWAAVDAALARLDRYDWLVFSSGNGVRWFLDRLLAGGGDLRRLGGVKLAAIGPGTAAELAKYRLKADLMPAEYRAESLAEALLADVAPRAVPPCPRRPRPPGPARTALGRRGNGRSGRRLLDDGGCRGRSGDRRGACGRPHPVGDGHQFGDRAIDGRPVRRRARPTSAWRASARSPPACLANWATPWRRRRKSTRWPAWSRRFWRRTDGQRR